MIRKENRELSQAVRMALWGGGASAAAVLSSVAQAQQAPAATAGAAAPAVEEVVVTGSRIATPSLEAVSPVTAISSEEVRETGVTRVEDLVNSLPQVVADQASGLSMGSTGIATVNLRGLGANRTLVLVNGRRLIGGDPTGGGANLSGAGALGYASVADINQIPTALIDRVDVLTGGASSTYGADAVAGVVNFVMNDHFEGVRLDGNFGIYNHSNHESGLDPLEAKIKQAAPTGTGWDGANKDFTLIMGHNFADGAGNLEAYLGYRREAPIVADHRDFAACVLNNGLNLLGYFATPRCQGSSNSAPTVIFPSASAPEQVNPDGTLGPRYFRYNFAASHYLQRIDERYTAGMFGHLKFNDNVEAYTEFMFMDDDTRGNYAAAGAFSGSGFATDPTTGFRDGNWYLNCGVGGFGNTGMNPYLTAAEFGNLCGAAAPGAQFYDPATGLAQVSLARRNVEGGPREDEYTHTTWRGVFGARGDLIPDWTYDASFAYSQVRVTDYHNNDTSSRNMQNAMLAIKDPATGQIVCQGRQSGCVPWNIWNPTIPVDRASLAYFSVPGLLTGNGQENVGTAYISGDLTHAGVKLPTADEGLKLVLGTEYRRETSQFRPDAELLGADLAGIGSPIVGYDATYHVWEGFTEIRMPLASNLPGVKTLDLEGGYRYSAYSSGFDTNTWKLGLVWAPTADVRIRGSYNRAVRAPNIAELNKSPYVALDSGTDLCALGTSYTAAQCALTGLKPSQYGSALLTSPAGQYNGQQGGNPNVKPEVGKTANVGLVFTPSFLPGFSATVDWTDIKMSGVITQYGPNLIQQNCIASGDPNNEFCKLIHRDPNGTLWASPEGYTTDPLVNLSQIENRSVDVGLAYRFDLGGMGRLRSRLDGTYLLKLVTTPGAGASYNCAGLFGPSCEPVTPKWRHRFTLDWDTPFAGIGFGATWRFFGGANNSLLDAKTPDYVGAATIAAGGLPADASLPRISYLDLRASYTLDKFTVRVGVNNVLDKDPPFVDIQNSGGNQAPAESNTFPGVYDVLGRFIYLNATIDF